jgi:hypothetical protein
MLTHCRSLAADLAALHQVETGEEIGRFLQFAFPDLHKLCVCVCVCV